MEALAISRVKELELVHNPLPGTKAVDVRKAMLRIPQVVESLDSIERAVLVASTAKMMGDYEDAELVRELKNAFEFIAKDVGFRGTKDAEWIYTIGRLSKVMKVYFAKLTIVEIKLAFEMAMTGELDDYLPRDRFGNPDKEHYQSFNVNYVSKILNAYKERREAVLNKAYKATPKPEKKTVIESGVKENTIRLVVEAFAYFKYRGYLPKLSPIGELLIYQSIERMGYAEPYEVTSVEQDCILRATIYQYASKQMVGDVKRLKNEGRESKEIQYPAMVLARRKKIVQAFREMVEDDVNIIMMVWNQ